MGLMSTLKSGRRSIAIATVAAILALVPTQSTFAQDEVWLRHSPAHPAASEAVWVAVRAHGGPFEEIRITYDVYALSESSGGVFPDQTLIAQEQEGGRCSPREQLDETWCFTRLASFGDARLVSITASAIRMAGGPAVAESYLFASGKYPGTGPIPIRRSGPIKSRIDVVLVPERVSLESTNTDPAVAMRAFVGRLSTFVNDVFFGFDPYSGTPGNPYRRIYNFYYTNQPSKLVDPTGSEPCGAGALPAQQDQFEANFDAVALLHCRDPNGQRGYNRRPDALAGDACERRQDYKCAARRYMTTEVDYPKSVGHEMGHLLHGLTDEYCGPTAYTLASSNSNVFRTETSCQGAAVRLGYQAAACTRICASGTPTTFWKISHPVEPSSIMDSGMHETHSRFFNPTIARILSNYLDCVDNNVCYDGSLGAGAAPPDATGPQVEFSAEVGPSTLAHDVIGASGAVVDGSEAEASDSPEKIVVTQSLFELQQRLREPLARIGEDAPAAATISSPEVVTEAGGAPLDLGVQVELDGASGRLIDIVPVNPSAGTAPETGSPTVMVVGEGEGGRAIFRTEVPDPRWVEIEGHSWVRNDSGTITVPLPTTRGVTDIVMQANQGGETTAFKDVQSTTGAVVPNSSNHWMGGQNQPTELRVNVEQALRGACAEYPTAPACQ